MPGLSFCLPSQPFEILLLNRPDGTYTVSHRRERDINRGTLLNIAPDREELLLSHRTTDDLRKILKISVTPRKGHWIYRSRQRTYPIRHEGNPRLSAFLASDSKEASDDTDRKLRRVFSMSKIPPFAQINASMEKRLYDLPSADFDIMFDDCGSPIVVSNEQLISPRPLGPTHLLIIHAKDDRADKETFAANPYHYSKVLRSRKYLSPLPHSTVVEMPINDLLFVLNVPNIAHCHWADGPTASPLPPRLHKELPRVLLGPVPHLETFPELVTYLHTQNQAELFRHLIPEWIRDTLHPFQDTHCAVSRDAGDGNSSLWETSSRTSAKALPRMFGMLRPSSPVLSFEGLLGGSPALLRSSTESTISNSEQMLTAVMQELVALSRDHSFADRAGDNSDYDEDPPAIGKQNAGSMKPSDLLVDTLVRLDAFRDNLHYIGYFSPMLWRELDFYHKLLLKAVSWRARIDAD